MTILRTLAACAALFFANVSLAAAQASDEYMMTENEVYMVQTKLYELFHYHDFPDGKSGPKTRAAIASWQQRIDHPATGYPTNEEFRRLEAIPIPTDLIWGAMSGAGDGAYQAAWNYSLRSEAYITAERGCWERSSRPEICITVTVWASKDVGGWISSVMCEREDLFTKDSLFASGIGASSQQAREAAFGRAEREGFPRYSCHPYKTIAADGSHK